jgi:hypothetical protein
LWKTSDRHNLKSNCTPYSTLLPGHTRASHRPGCWKQLPLPVPHCWQYRRRLESIATVRIMIADPSPEVCVPRHLSRLWGRSTAVTAVSSRQSRDAPAEALLGLRQGQFYVVGDSDILLSRFSRGREGVFGPSIYEYRFENGKVREKIAFFKNIFVGYTGAVFFAIPQRLESKTMITSKLIFVLRKMF